MLQLNNEQQRAVDHRDGPMLVLAGPGSGKTAVLVNRVLSLVRSGVDPHGILVLTFSKAAAVQMQERFLKLADSAYPVTFGTFHAIFYHILKSQGLYRTARIITEKKKNEIMKATAVRKGIAKGNDPVFVDRLTDLAGLKKSGRDGYVKWADESDLQALLLVYDDYNRLVKEEGYIDFDDMIADCLKMLKSNDSIRKKWQERFSYILVDEFQDIDSRQYEVLRLLSKDRGNVFCVGDDDQSIYSFRGSDPSLLRSFTADHENYKKVCLKVNYRCPGQVIYHAGLLIGNNKDRFTKEQVPARKEDHACIVHRCFRNGADEAAYVKDVIEKIAAKASEKGEKTSIGVLYRISRSGDLIEENLRRKGIEYVRKDQKAGFYEKEWVKDVLAYLRLSIDPNINDMFRILNRPNRGLLRECVGDGKDMREHMLSYFGKSEYCERINRLFSDVDLIRGLPCYGAVNYILRGMGLLDHFRQEYRSDSPDFCWDDEIEDLLDRARPFIRIQEWLKSIEFHEQIIDDVKDIGPCKIELRTIHASKGLEYDHVIMIGLQEGVFPLKKYDDEESLAEERRLFYVGMTRCRKRLWLTGIKRDEYGKGESRFLKEAGLKDETIGSIPYNVV